MKALQSLGIPEILIIGDRTTADVVMQCRYAEPAFLPVRGKLVGKPAELRFSQIAVVVLGLMAFTHRGV